MKSIDRNIAINKKRVAALLDEAVPYADEVAHIISAGDYSRHESALAISGGQAYQNEVQGAIEHLKGAKSVILIGIGGSSLAAEAVYRALSIRTSPALFVFDSIDDDTLSQLGEIKNRTTGDAELAIVVVSKSGTTTETIANAAHVLGELEAIFGNGIHDRMVFIGTEGSAFLKLGKKKGAAILSFPKSIGGRYSAFSAAAVAPLSLLGIDTASFLKGASDAMTAIVRAEAVKRAVTLAALAEGGIRVVNFFTLVRRLEGLGAWFRQLLAESIGKETTKDGGRFDHQLLPVVTTAPDLHSMLQLYFGGYPGMFTHFMTIRSKGVAGTRPLPDHWLLTAAAGLNGRTPGKIGEAIEKGVLKAYAAKKLPHRIMTLEKLSAYELGFIMSTLMFETMVLGHLFKVDPFDQPNVESYKSFTREILG